MNNNIIGIIEARMGSSRFPGKVLTPINGIPALERMVKRISKCRLLDDFIVATSVNKTDDKLADWLKTKGIKFHRGSEDDVLSRVVGAAEMMKAEIIVELTGDCILSDPDVIDLGIETFLNNKCDIVSNCGTYLTYPMGIYVQVFRYKDLKYVSENINDPKVREHVSIYFYENTNKYSLINLIAPNRIKGPHVRTQLDYKEDLEFNECVFNKLENKYGEDFGVIELMDLIRSEPQILDINKHCIEKTV